MECTGDKRGHVLNFIKKKKVHVIVLREDVRNCTCILVIWETFAESALISLSIIIITSLHPGSKLMQVLTVRVTASV